MFSTRAYLCEPPRKMKSHRSGATLRSEPRHALPTNLGAPASLPARFSNCDTPARMPALPGLCDPVHGFKARDWFRRILTLALPMNRVVAQPSRSAIILAARRRRNSQPGTAALRGAAPMRVHSWELAARQEHSLRRVFRQKRASDGQKKSTGLVLQ